MTYPSTNQELLTQQIVSKQGMMPESVTSKQMEPVFLKNQGEELQKFTDVSGTLLARDWKGFGNQAQTGVMEWQ